MRVNRARLNWGIFLIVLGAMPLAYNQGIVSSSTLAEAWRLWPLILVGLGLYFLIRTVAPRFDLDPYWPAGLLVLGVVLLALSIRRTPGGTTP